MFEAEGVPRALSGPSTQTPPSHAPAGPTAVPADIVTLLFTDMEGSTRLARAFPTSYIEILDEHRRLLREAFRDGAELDSPGDAFFVAYDSARVAVAAAAAAQLALAGYPWPGGAQVRVRMGLHTAAFSRQREPGRYVGLEVNRAARICSAGHGGQVLLSDVTGALVAGDLPAGAHLLDLGPHQLRDFDRVERLWQLGVDGLAHHFGPLRTGHGVPVGPTATGPAAAGPTGPAWLDAGEPVPFVGRADELATLRSAWTWAAAGHRVLALTGGEAGIGKTSLARELAREVHGAGGLVLHGRFDEEVIAPYQAFRQALGEYARGRTEPVLRTQLDGHGAEISRLFPEVAGRVGAFEPPLPGPAEAERFRLFEALDAWLSAIATPGPALLVLDDLHWADRPSLLLLRHLLRAPRATPLLVVGTYRATDVDRSELGEFLPVLGRDIDCRRLTLDGLSVAETVELLGQVGGGEPGQARRTIAAELRAETSGNPFYLRELIRHLRTTGALRPGAGRVGIGGLEIPETVRDAVRWHLDRLSPGCPDLLAVAAAIGPEFDLEVLAEAAGTGDGEVLDLVEEAAVSGLVLEVEGDARYAFAHAVVRRVLQDRLSRTRRARLHLKIAAALERRPHTDPAELAHHYVASAGSGATVKAIHFARLAGRRALREAAYESAVLHFRRALDALDRHGANNPTVRAELLLELGSAHDGAGEYEARDRWFVRAAAVARDIDRADLFARAALGYGGLLPAAVDPDVRARALLAEALRRLGPEDSVERARVLGRLAHWEHYALPHAARRELCDDAVAMARRLDHPPTLGGVLFHRGWALDGPGDVTDQLSLGAEVVRLGRDTGDAELDLQGQRLRLDALFASGDFTAAREAGSALARIARRLRHPEHLRFATMWDVVVAAVEGRYDEAERSAAELRVRLRAVRHPHADMIYAAQRFAWGYPQGRADEFLPMFAAAAAPRPDYLGGRALLVWCHAATGDLDRVRATLAELTPAAIVGMDRNYLWWGTVVGFVHATVAAGDRDWAAALYRLALPFAEQNATLGLAAFLGAASHHLGLLAGVLGRWDDAACHFEAALERHRDMRSPASVALTELAYADVLLRRDGPGDGARVAGLRAAGLVVAAELGLGLLAPGARAAVATVPAARAAG